MSEDRKRLRTAIIVLLDAIAKEHPSSHQEAKANRYVLPSRHGAMIEIMFQKDKDADDPPNLWCLEKAAGTRLPKEVPSERSPATKVWTRRGKFGELLYGRHSALRTMAQLEKADLIYFAPISFQQIGQIFDRLLDVTPADLR